ncbi:hypothetical protein PANDA_014003 [Ailuropoda melanoleuca]|uniref:Uncharacterized protein n=1 Tax=Ailuropoda melanoleuca TaxID=9646 RepID=D2HQ62_AILME|nr:hypothetical protein PANDA_014003 [Ailuropoda melanoleuca]
MGLSPLLLSACDNTHPAPGSPASLPAPRLHWHVASATGCICERLATPGQQPDLTWAPIAHGSRTQKVDSGYAQEECGRGKLAGVAGPLRAKAWEGAGRGCSCLMAKGRERQPEPPDHCPTAHLACTEHVFCLREALWLLLSDGHPRASDSQTGPPTPPRMAQKQKAWLLASSHTHQGKLKMAAVTAKLVSTREGVRVEGGARAAGGRVDNDVLRPKQKRKPKIRPVHTSVRPRPVHPGKATQELVSGRLWNGPESYPRFCPPPLKDLATRFGGHRVAALTLDAEAELLLLVGDVAGDRADQGHGQGAGHTRDAPPPKSIPSGLLPDSGKTRFLMPIGCKAQTAALAFSKARSALSESSSSRQDSTGSSVYQQVGREVACEGLESDGVGPSVGPSAVLGCGHCQGCQIQSVLKYKTAMHVHAHTRQSSVRHSHGPRKQGCKAVSQKVLKVRISSIPRLRDEKAHPPARTLYSYRPMTIFKENPPENGKAVTLDTGKYQSVAHPFSGFPGSTYQRLLDNMPVGANDTPPSTPDPLPTPNRCKEPEEDQAKHLLNKEAGQVQQLHQACNPDCGFQALTGHTWLQVHVKGALITGIQGCFLHAAHHIGHTSSFTLSEPDITGCKITRFPQITAFWPSDRGYDSQNHCLTPLDPFPTSPRVPDPLWRACIAPGEKKKHQTMLIPNANPNAFGAHGLGVTSLDISYHPFSLISSMPQSFHWLLSAKLIQEAPCMHVPKEVYRKKSHPLPSHSAPQETVVEPRPEMKEKGRFRGCPLLANSSTSRGNEPKAGGADRGWAKSDSNTTPNGKMPAAAFDVNTLKKGSSCSQLSRTKRELHCSPEWQSGGAPPPPLFGNGCPGPHSLYRVATTTTSAHCALGKLPGYLPCATSTSRDPPTPVAPAPMCPNFQNSCYVTIANAEFLFLLQSATNPSLQSPPRGPPLLVAKISPTWWYLFTRAIGMALPPPLLLLKTLAEAVALDPEHGEVSSSPTVNCENFPLETRTFEFFQDDLSVAKTCERTE